MQPLCKQLLTEVFIQITYILKQIFRHKSVRCCSLVFVLYNILYLYCVSLCCVNS